MRRWLPVAALLLLAVGVLAAACGGDEEKATNGGATSKATTATSQAAAQTVDVEADDFYFQPTEIAAQAGKPVTVTLKNEGKATHTFTIDSLKVDQTIAPGKDAEITFTPTKAGDLVFYCQFHHTSNGMQGTVKVSGAGGAAAPNTPVATVAGGGFSGY